MPRGYWINRQRRVLAKFAVVLACSMMLLLLSVLLFAGVPWTSGVLEFTKDPGATVRVKEGSNATLIWGYAADDKAAELKSISWRLYNKTQDAFPLTLLVEYENGQVTENPNLPPLYAGRLLKTGNATLVIKNVTLQHSNRYKCLLVAKPGHRGKESIVELIVEGQASVDRPVEFAKVDGSVTFTGSAINVQSQDFSWNFTSKSGETRKVVANEHYSIVSVPGSSQLTIMKISINESGYYVCDATSSAGEPNNASAFLLLASDLTEIKDDSLFGRRLYRGTIGKDLIIYCPVSATPPPVVTWKKNGNRLGKGETFLTFTPLKNGDIGNYSCSATNMETSLGPFDISVVEDIGFAAQLPVKASNGTEQEPAKLEWSPVNGADYYVVKIGGTEIRDDLVCGVRTSLDVHYHTLEMEKNGQRPDKKEVCAYVSAINDEGVIGKTSVCQKLKIPKPSD